MYIIKRHEDGAYVTRPGEHASYTNDIRRVRKWVSREMAEIEACGNESVVILWDEVEMN